jgi:hypothetical protein
VKQISVIVFKKGRESKKMLHEDSNIYGVQRIQGIHWVNRCWVLPFSIVAVSRKMLMKLLFIIVWLFHRGAQSGSSTAVFPFGMVQVFRRILLKQ